MSTREASRKLLQVIEEIHAEGRKIIGERWAFYSTMKRRADHADLVGMVIYFEALRRVKRGGASGRSSRPR
jgi:hypothetical protein